MKMKKLSLYIPAILISLSLASCSGNKNGEAASVTTNVAEKVKEVNVGVVENAPVARKKYDVKSGIVTFETIMEMSGMKMADKKILYFDDYGMKECEETYKDGKLTESFVSDGKERFKLFHEKKGVYKAGAASNGTAMPFNWNEVSQSDKDGGIAKQGEKMTVAGKDCETFTFITETAGEKTTTKYAGWNHVLLSMELQSKSMKSSEKAVKVEENASVPADKFSIPADYKPL